jgi:large subunit ribosomal protein L6
MSRIGKKPVPVPDNVKVAVNGSDVVVESGKNKLTMALVPQVKVTVDTKTKAVVVERTSEERFARAMHGTVRARIASMIEGVTKGFSKELEVIGVGWTAKVQGMKIVLTVGYADAKEVTIPAGVKVEVLPQNKIKVSGADKQAVGQTAAEIRRQRPPEPYNGKGIKYSDEHIVRKQGKAFAGGGA